jgi:GH35 family endo-1,4-beta-xylanase
MLAMLTAVATGYAQNIPVPSDAEILQQADKRIAQHRMGELVLRLVDGDGKPLADGTAVRVEQTEHAFLFGCNIFVLNKFDTPEENKAYADHFDQLFNYATLPFYWWHYVEEQGKPKDERTEEIIAWCKKHNIELKGHPLAWNFVDPKWLPDDIEAVKRLQFERIARCVDRFEGSIEIWDVVNEATMYSREMTRRDAPKQTQMIREMGVGPYIRKAFRVARDANPDATLIINDYRTGDGYALKVIEELVDEEGRPMYDVIGIQSHMHAGEWSPSHTWEVCRRFARFGKPLHFTEVTLLSGEQGWGLAQSREDFDWVSTEEGEKRQAEKVVEFYTVLFSHPSVEAITWWDFTDAKAWQGAPAGFLRRDLTPKPSYHALHKLIKQKWWTRLNEKTKDNGRFESRGFYGDYRVEAEIEGRKRAGTFRFTKNTKTPIEVTIR